ncbi:two-component system, OmpR family, sensor histidine kinase BaeS [Alteromonadaceae bacterium Bs31]|nr:two-component system, OmpR family, sensor histidine kinase BaeS [Alteromonadaceae bacterium Bs31]
MTLVLSTTAMLLFTHASVKQGFLDYVSQQAISRLQYLENAIKEVYAQEMSLSSLKDDQRVWRRLKYQTFREYIEQQSREALSNNEPPLHPSVKAQERAFVDQLILVDADKSIIVGEKFENAEYSWRELFFEDQLIGYIGYIKPKDFMRSVDRLFINQQLKAFALLSIGIFIGSFLIALLVSSWLVKPMSELSKAAEKISSGDYSVRINRAASDEMGALCNNFNELARTLSANEAARKQWVADISHEMRTPLSVLQAQIEAMQDGIRPTSEENLALLKTKIDSLSRLINDLYELSLSDLGALSYSKENLDLSTVINNIAPDYEQKLASDGLELLVENTLSEKARIFADPKRISQLFSNLLENSARYTDAPGKVLLRASREKHLIHITLEDSAPAVAEDQLDSIFDRLFRIETSRNRATGGAGLGLSICKNIVEAHNGRISAQQSTLGGLQIKLSFDLT